MKRNPSAGGSGRLFFFGADMLTVYVPCHGGNEPFSGKFSAVMNALRKWRGMRELIGELEASPDAAHRLRQHIREMEASCGQS